MKNFTILFISLIFAIVAGGQDLDEILESHFDVIGQDKVLKTESFEIKAKINQGGMEIPMTMYQKRPSYYKTVVEVQGMEILTGFDGETGWMLNPLQGSSEPVKLTGEQLKSIKEQADIDGRLYDWEAKGYKLEYLDTEEMEGTEVYVLELETKEGDKQKYFIDVDSFLILKLESKVKVQGSEQTTEVVYSNYDNVEGMVFPFLLNIFSGGQNIMSLTFEDVTLNPDLDDSIFKMPEITPKEPASDSIKEK